MDPPPDGEDYASSHLSRIDRDEDLVASYWRTHRKPATNSEEQTMAQRLEPFVRRQQRNNKIVPAITSPGSSTRLSPPSSPFFSSDDMSNTSIPLKVWQKSPMRNSNASPPASLDDVSKVERSALCFGGSLPKLGQKSRKRSKESLKDKDPDKSVVIMNASGSNNNTPPNSFSSQEIPPGSNKSIPSTTIDSINTTSDSNSYSCADKTADSCDSTQPQASGSTHQVVSDSNSSGSGNGTPENSKKQRPGVPRIIIPDGTSINLSTPPTTPRQQVRQIRPRQMPVPIWPDRFIELRDRLKASERMALFKWSKPKVPTELDAQGQNADPKEPETGAAAAAAAVPTHPDTTTATNRDPSSTRLGFSPAFGVLDIPHYSTGPESETSSQKDIWWDHEDSDEESYDGGWCSKEQWRHVFCTWSGLTNTGKRLVTTTLGLVVILALALTALGKVRDRNRVSDVIPESLEGQVFEAQVMVIQDFHGQKSKMLEKRQEEAREERLRETKVPFWQHPLGEGCFRELCEMEDTWKEFIAFMNPVSFGIQLPQNWPSLCSSCIEISRNQFVYRTTVRVLGDLSQCAATPSLPLPSTVPPTLSPASASKIQTVGNADRAKPPSTPISRQYHGHGTLTSVSKPAISKSTSKPLTRAPDERKAALPKRQVEPPQEVFPDLIVDTATFNNLTEYDSVNAIQSMQLRVQFRFVLCDD